NNIYIYNLRGFIRGKVGEEARKEGQNVFNILQGVAIIILVKNDNVQSNELKYKDIGDYLSRTEKLDILKEEKTILNSNLKTIKPNEKNDWINQRVSNYDSLWLMGSKRNLEPTVFKKYSGGL